MVRAIPRRLARPLGGLTLFRSCSRDMNRDAMEPRQLSMAVNAPRMGFDRAETFFCCLARAAPCCPPARKSIKNLVALTGIEGANNQFSSVQLSLSDSKYVQLGRLGPPQTCHRLPTLSLGRHSSSCKSTGATLRSYSPRVSAEAKTRMINLSPRSLPAVPEPDCELPCDESITADLSKCNYLNTGSQRFE